MRFPEFSGEWKHVHLKEIAEFQKQRISTALLNNNNYISTENILQDFKGIQCSSSMPANVNVIKYQNEDILLSNIRPYLKRFGLQIEKVDAAQMYLSYEEINATSISCTMS